MQAEPALGLTVTDTEPRSRHERPCFQPPGVWSADSLPLQCLQGLQRVDPLRSAFPRGAPVGLITRRLLPWLVSVCSFFSQVLVSNQRLASQTPFQTLLLENPASDNQPFSSSVISLTLAHPLFDRQSPQNEMVKGFIG